MGEVTLRRLAEAATNPYILNAPPRLSALELFI